MTMFSSSRNFFAFTGAFLALAVAAQADIKRTVEKTFTVKSGGDLKVQTSGGDIRVVTGPGDDVKVTAHERFDTNSEAKADEILKDLDLRIEQQGNTVTAVAKYERHGGFSWGGRTPISVSFTVTVPEHFNADLGTSGGDITLERIDGHARLRTSGGDLKIDQVAGEVNGETSGGNISLHEGKARVRLSTSGGDIHVDRAGGEADLTTSGGNIEIKSVQGRVTAITSGGNIRASITGPLQGDCRLSTSGGEVEVAVDKSAAFELKSHTSGGEVDADGLTIAIEKGGLRRSSLSGKVNGGGPLLALDSSGGDIRVRLN